MEENKPQPNKSNLKTVRTYMSDMADTVRENEISVIKVALAEQNKNAREDLYREAEGTPVKKIFFVIGGLILIAGAVYGSYYLIKQKKAEDVPQQILREETIISYDETSQLDLTDGTNFSGKIKISKSEISNLKSNIASIKFISLSKEINGIKEKISVADFFAKMGFTAPSSLVRSLSDSYMVGSYTKNPSGSTGTTDSTPRLFLIFQTKDYEFSYAGMLEWEKTIASDVFDLFELNTNENKIKISERTFKDIIINNKDSRILFNENERPILYYIFANKDTFIITDSLDAIKEISSRLLLKNIKPL